jgi:hypothetical protein
MSTAETPAGESRELTQRLDVLTREVEGLTAALRWARTVRLLLMLALAILVVVTTYLFYNLGMRLQSKEYLAALQTVGQKKFEEKSVNYTNQLRELTNHTAPVIGDAFSAQFHKDMPLFLQGLEKEGATFRANVEETMLHRIDEHSQQSLEKHRQVIEQEIVAIDKNITVERVEKNLEKAIHRLTERYQIAELQRQLDALADNWEKMPAAEPMKGEPSPQDQFTGSLLTLLNYRLSHLPQGSRP